MLGFGAISSRAISAGPFNLIGYAAAISAVGGISFSGSATWGAFLHASARGGIHFSGSAPWTTLNALSASGQFGFSGRGLLVLAGRPIVFNAAPERLTFNGLADRYSFSASAGNYTFRGMR